MIHQPLIGITASNTPESDWGEGKFQLDRDGQLRLYSEAVALAGGLPVLLPVVRTPLDFSGDESFSACGPGNLFENAGIYMQRLDGLLLTGGGDVAPGREVRNIENFQLVDRTRDVWESALLAAALKADKPVLGICRGLQLMNAALGGTLYEDLPTDRPGPVEHIQNLPRARATHDVTIEADTRLAEALNFSLIKVNSHHHQGIRDMAQPLKAAARSIDGLIEAAEHTTARFAVGVQWHPEGQASIDHSRALFAAFVMAAENNK